MRRALSEYQITPDQIIQKQNIRLGIFKRLLEVFNSGDVLQLTNLLLNITGIDCLLLTPSLFQELHGRNAVIQFWTLILEAFPDGIWQLNDTSYEENGFVSTRFIFTGTKVAALPSDVLLHRWGKFREMMFKNSQSGIGVGGIGGVSGINGISGMGGTTTSGVTGGGISSTGGAIGGGTTPEAQVATFRELCTHENVPTTSGPFIPRGQTQWDATDLPESHGLESTSNYLPHHQQYQQFQQQQQKQFQQSSTHNTSTPNIKTERFSPQSNSEASHPVQNTSTTSSTNLFGSSTTNGGIGSGLGIGSNPPLSAIMGCPTVKLTGYMTVTFNSQNQINRFIFVWNTASLIGQILGLSNGDLETMSQYFNPPNT